MNEQEVKLAQQEVPPTAIKPMERLPLGSALADGQAVALPEAALGARKRLFVGLICATSLAVCLLLVFGWGIPFVGFGNIHPSMPYITGSILILLVLFIAWVALELILMVATGNPIWASTKTWGITLRLFLPLVEVFGRIFGLSSAEVRRSLIQVNNEIVQKRAHLYKPEEV